MYIAAKSTSIRSALIRLLLVFFSLTGSGCAYLQSLQAQDLWEAGGKPLSYVEKPLLLVYATDPQIRRKAEADWVLSLRDRDIAAAPAYAPLPELNQVTVQALATLAEKHDLDSLFTASISLDKGSAEQRHRQLGEHMEYRATLAFDVFVPQVEMAAVTVAAYSLGDKAGAGGDQLLRWQAVYFVPVKNGRLDWSLVARSANQDMAAAGLRKKEKPPEKKMSEKQMSEKQSIEKQVTNKQP